MLCNARRRLTQSSSKRVPHRLDPAAPSSAAFRLAHGQLAPALARIQFSFFPRRSILGSVREGPEFRRSHPSAMGPTAADD